MDKTILEYVNDAALKHKVAVTVLEQFIQSLDSSIISSLFRNKDISARMSEQLNKAYERIHGENPNLPNPKETRELYDTATKTAMSLLADAPNKLYVMALIYRCALYDAYMTDFVNFMLKAFPYMLKSNKTLTYEQILEKGTMGGVVSEMAEREVMEFSYQSTQKQFEWLKRKFGIEVFDDDETLSQLVELNARRNLLVHANGVVNQRYILESGRTDIKAGEVISVDTQYWKAASAFLLDVMMVFNEKMILKFKLREMDVEAKKMATTPSAGT